MSLIVWLQGLSVDRSCFAILAFWFIGVRLQKEISHESSGVSSQWFVGRTCGARPHTSVPKRPVGVDTVFLSVCNHYSIPPPRSVLGCRAHLSQRPRCNNTMHLYIPQRASVSRPGGAVRPHRRRAERFHPRCVRRALRRGKAAPPSPTP